jgi:hypothetical protein
MYTSFIGKKFLSLYKEKENKPDDYSARQFFDDVLFPCFFDHETHLMHVGNSPFFQKPKEDDVKLYGSKSKAQYQNLLREIESGDSPSGAIYVGYGAKEISSTSTGQLTSLTLITSKEDIYLSWIGEALGIGVNGGLVMLIDNDRVMLNLYEGWQYYRLFLEQTPDLKDKQIETWNGHWICHTLSSLFNSNNALSGFNLETEEVLGKIAIPTNSWTKVLFALSRNFHDQESLTIYAYNLSQTNTTLGFINVYLSDIRRPFELRDKIFMDHSNFILNDNEIESLETFYNFRNACKFGTIGLKALEPAKLREFMPKGTIEYAQGKEFKFIDEHSKNIFSLYKLWIIAMLNKTELLQLAADVATSLLSLEREQSARDKTKTGQTQSSKELLESKSLKVFIDGLTENINEKNALTFKNVVDNVVTMPSDNFPLFITLIRFEYSYQKNISSHQTN